MSVVNKELQFGIWYDTHCLPGQATVQTQINYMSNCLLNIPYYDNWQANIDVWTLETKELYL